MKIYFAKYEGAGNDFVLIDNRSGYVEPTAKLIAGLCDRRFGIGGDGLMLLEDDSAVQFRMRYFNADGGESTMCGNGGRCIAFFAEHLGIGGNEKKFMAPDGIHYARILDRTADNALVALGMSDINDIHKVLHGFFVDSGSPHYVEFVKDVDKVDVHNRGRILRNDHLFDAYGGVNVNFVELTGYGKLKIRTYERGVEDETLACGTGVTASAVAASFVYGGDAAGFDIEVRGGMLRVDFKKSPEGIYTGIVLTGNARRVFTGETEMENFV